MKANRLGWIDVSGRTQQIRPESQTSLHFLVFAFRLFVCLQNCLPGNINSELKNSWINSGLVPDSWRGVDLAGLGGRGGALLRGLAEQQQADSSRFLPLILSGSGTRSSPGASSQHSQLL